MRQRNPIIRAKAFRGGKTGTVATEIIGGKRGKHSLSHPPIEPG